MKNTWSRLTSLVLLGGLMFMCGCAATLPVSYAPSSTPVYTKSIGRSVTVRDVTDNRSMDEFTYYEFNMDKGKFDKPLKDIVKLAVETELRRAGMTVGSTKTVDVNVDCEIMDCRATITQKIFASNILDLSCSIKFKWTDVKTGRLIEENDRTEKQTRKLGVGNLPTLPFGAPEVKDYGNDLINTLLPRAIEKEIRLNRYLQDAVK